MAQLLQIKTRMKSVDSTLKITKAMKMIAAARLVKAKDRVIKTEPVARKLESIVQHLRDSEYIAKLPLSEIRTEGKDLYVVLTTDRGFCGGFNFKLLHFAEDKKLHSKDPVDIAPIGGKGLDYFEKAKGIFKLSDEVTTIWEEELFNQSRLLYQELEDLFLKGEYKAIYLIYNKFESVLTQHPIKKQLLPIVFHELEEDKNKELHSQIDYLFEPDEKSLVDTILPLYCNLNTFLGFVETKAGEYGARMTSMEGANINGEKLTRQLKIQFQRARQEAITRELTELIGGVECLRREQT